MSFVNRDTEINFPMLQLAKFSYGVDSLAEQQWSRQGRRGRRFRNRRNRRIYLFERMAYF